MELKKFIAESLTQISEGIIEAKKKNKANDFIINPFIIQKFDSVNQNNEYIGFTKGERIIQNIKFDLAVTIDKGHDVGGGIEVASGIFKGGIFGKKNFKENSVSRIQFTVPISMPIDYLE